MENYIFGMNEFRKFPFDLKSQCRRYTEPEFPGRKNKSHICASNASGKSAKRSIRACMRIRANYQVARPHMPFFRHHLVAYTFKNIIIQDSLLLCESAKEYAVS